MLSDSQKFKKPMTEETRFLKTENRVWLVFNFHVFKRSIDSTYKIRKNKRQEITALILTFIF